MLIGPYSESHEKIVFTKDWHVAGASSGQP